MKKLKKLGLLVLLLMIMTSCKSKDEEIVLEDPVVEEEASIETVLGLDNVETVVNEYFHPLKDVLVTNQEGEDITHLLHVSGNVNYGRVGTYTLQYSLEYGEDVVDVLREIDVVDGTIIKDPAITKTTMGITMEKGEGSYFTGTNTNIDHPVNPIYLENYLLDRAVPSNGWWTSLLVQNYGGGNGLYTNPFRSAFGSQGVEVTNPGEGFVQYWNPDGYNTMANFSLALPDMFLKTTTLPGEYQTRVIDYSDTSVKVAMRDQQSYIDHMVMTYTQGSPYIFAEVADQSSPLIKLASNGVSNYEFFTVNGNLINGTSYTGDGLIIKLVQKHIGYQTSRPSQVGQPIYGDRYFLISTPKDTVFTFSSDNHPGGLNNRIDMDLRQDNYFSVAIMNGVSEGEYYHEHAYNKPLVGHVSYDIDYEDSVVYTTYDTAYQTLREDMSSTLLQFLMPHHYQQSDVVLTEYVTNAIRGTLKIYEGRRFETSLGFYGMLPAMTVPMNSEFSESTMIEYLTDLSSRTLIGDSTNFLNDEGPYWNSKAIYPLAQGIITADQLGEESLKDALIGKLKYVLTDWFTYSNSEEDRFLYYNQTWGTVYYSNNDFNTASEISDHSFTHGYLIYASSVLAMYDKTFVEEYGDMVEMLLRDYMHPNRNDTEFAYLRSFDSWAAHTWAHGFGTFAEGNNIESSSEAINSWVGGYLWAIATDDQALKDAAIYGFVHELNHAKTYMFDYTEEIFPEEYSQYASVAAMIWGGKYDYATWFGANPTFIYGIQWLPNGEYLSGYALTVEERERLADIYEAYLFAKNQEIDTWFANMWSIQALLDSSVAINQFDAAKILNDDYPSDLAQTYYLIHGLHTYGHRTTEYTMEVHDRVASTIYINNNGDVYALVWNPSVDEQTVTFALENGEQSTYTIQPETFESVKLN